MEDDFLIIDDVRYEKPNMTEEEILIFGKIRRAELRRNEALDDADMFNAAVQTYVNILGDMLKKKA